MRVSSKEYYGLAALTELARHDALTPLAVADIAEARQIPVKYLEQVMACLRRAGLVVATRGTRGGYRLAQRPTAITIADVVHALEGGIERSDRVEGGDDRAHAVWQVMQRRVCQALEAITLADVALDQTRPHRFLDADEFEPLPAPLQETLR